MSELKMENRLYIVRRDKRWSYIDQNGNLLFPFEANECLEFAEGLGGRRFKSDLQIIDANTTIIGQCEILNTPNGSHFSNGLLSASANLPEMNRAGYIDKMGSWKIAPAMRSAFDFHNGIAVAEPARTKDEMSEYGSALIDLNGNWLCEPMFHQILPFADDTSITFAYKFPPTESKSNKLLRILIDKQGNQVGNDFYESGGSAGEGLVIVCKDSKWGAVNEIAERVIPFTFEGMSGFCNGYAAAFSVVKKVGVIDKTGHWVIHPRFNWVGEYSEGLFPAQIKAFTGLYKTGYIDLNGDWVIEPQFEDAMPFKNGVAKVYSLVTNEEEDKASLFGYIDKKGEYIWEPS